jgi:hypothetical protein
MNWKFSSAGSRKISRQMFLFCFLLSSVACRQNQNQDQRAAQIQQQQQQREIKRLSEENQRLSDEIRSLRAELKAKQNPTPQPQSSPKVPENNPMTVERMKTEIKPLLEETIDYIKKTSETPRKQNQYGMRIEYDLKNAVYGLINDEDGTVPYAKVIVQYEKFLESEKDSRSYGSGSSTFLFAYHNHRWTLQSYE